MPLNRPALSLGAGPRGVQDARRWVVEAFGVIGRGDLAEAAEVGVSELVTNALLHGAPPILVRVRGTQDHPRVEVRDGSTEPPSLPTASDDDLDDLLTFGRGLSIVARASQAWGAEIEDDGKTVWFTPAAEFSEDVGPEGRITGAVSVLEQTGEQPADPIQVHLIGVPVKDYGSFQNHFRELRREVRLLAMAHESDYPLARDLAEVFNRLGRPLTLGVGSAAVRAAQESGRAVADLDIAIGRETARGVGRFVELLELTDAFCRAEKMLSLARTPRQHAFQTWYLGEFIRQADDEPAQPWAGPVDAGADDQRRSSVS